MKYMLPNFALIVIMCLAQNIFASSFRYQVETSFESPSLLALAEIQDVLQNEGLWALDLQNTGRLDFIGVDQVYFNSTLKSKIFIKFGLNPNLINLPPEIPVADGWVSHFKTRDNISYAVFFENVNADDREIIRRALMKISKKRTKSNVWLQLLNSYGIRKSVAAGTSCGKNPNTLNPVQKSLEEILTFQFLATCSSHALKGAASTVTGPFEALKQLAASSPGAFWKNASEQFENMKKFVTHLKEEIKNLGKVFQSLDAKTVAEIGCSIAGKAITSALIGVATAGAGALVVANVLKNITTMVNKLLESSQLLEKLEKLRMLGILKNPTIVGEVVSCAVR